MSEWLNGFLPSKLFPIHCCFCVIWFSLWFNKLSLWHFKNSSLQSVNGIVLMPLRIVALTSLNGDESHSVEREKSRNKNEWKVENGRHVPNVWCNFFPRSVMNSTWFVLFYLWSYNFNHFESAHSHTHTPTRTGMIAMVLRQIDYKKFIIVRSMLFVALPFIRQQKILAFSTQTSAVKMSDKTFKRSFEIFRLWIVLD